MATSSKNKTELDLQVRVTVLEQLTDRLMERVDRLAGSVMNTEANSKELLQIVSNLQTQQHEEWGNDRMEEVKPTEEKKEEVSPNDEVTQMWS